MKNEQRIERQPGAVQFRSWKARTRRLNLVKRYKEATEALASAVGRELGLVMANRGTWEAGLGEPGKLKESKSEQRRRTDASGRDSAMERQAENTPPVKEVTLPT